MFECHLTYDNVDAKQERLLTAYAKLQEWKTSYIVDDPVLGPGKRFFLTAHDRDVRVLYAKMVRACSEKTLPEPVREKIEQVVHDTKFGVTLSFPREPSAPP